jgi:hypothetical protein
MASLDRITRVDIALNTLAVQRGEFGIPIVVAPLLTFQERVRVYTSYDAAVDDALPPLALTALSDCFAQIPRPRQVKVGRRQVLDASITASELIALADYTITIGTTDYTYTAPGTAPTASDVATGLKAEIDADLSTTVTATVSGNDLVIAPIDPANFDIVTLGNYLEWSDFSPMSAATAVADDMTAIQNEDNNWYGIVPVERDVTVIEDFAEWTETQEKLLLIASDQADILNPALDTDLFSTLKNTRYFRTAGIFHKNAATEYPDAAWAGRVFTIQPGAETWALKSLASVTPSNLSETNYQTITNKGGNTFEFYQPQLALTNPGRTFAGEWIDVIRFRDWLKDLIQTNMVQMKINRDKVPYTDEGIQLCVNNLRGSLRRGQQVGGIAPDELDAQGKTVPGFVITYPLSVEVDPADKAARVLRISFVARLAGAVHLTEITGALAYTLE